MFNFWKTIFFFCDFGCAAIASIALYSYAFQVTDQSGYVMDGITCTVSVAAAIFLALLNNHNKIENLRIHPEWDGYSHYCAYAKSKHFQPVSRDTYNSLRKAGFDPVTNTYE